MTNSQRTPERPVRRLSFNHIIPFKTVPAGVAFEEAFAVFGHAEGLGLDDGWLRTRHLQTVLPSPVVFTAALAQRTERIGLGTAVIPVEYENPFRLAEDLATADVLSGGRVLPGLSVHEPGYAPEVNDIVHDAGWRVEDYGRGRIERLRDLIAGAPVREVPPYNGIGGDFDSATVEPRTTGLVDRLWYGAGSLGSVTWAGSANLNLLVSNIESSETGETDFSAVQRGHIDAYRAAHPAGAAARVNVSRVILPTDGATPSQLARYREYVASRAGRVGRLNGPKTIVAPDLIGSVDELVATILDDPAFQAADDYQLLLPFELEFEDWKQILDQFANRIGPALGWRPGTATTL